VRHRLGLATRTQISVCKSPLAGNDGITPCETRLSKRTSAVRVLRHSCVVRGTVEKADARHMRGT